MDLLVDAAHFLADPANWAGGRGIPTRVLDHLVISLVPLAAAIAVAVPLGMLAGHFRRGHTVGALVANVGRAIPTLGLLVFAVVLIFALDWNFRFWPIVIALFLLGLHPLFTNSYTAVRDVDASVVEAARGMGFDERQVLLGVELPLASPVILTAVRITAIQLIATAPLAGLVGGVGLGGFIIGGMARQDYGESLAGTLLVAAIALAADQLVTLVERLVVPRSLSGGEDRFAEVAATGRAA